VQSSSDQSEAESRDVVAAIGDLRILGPRIPAPPAGDRAALYLTVVNTGVDGDMLISISSDAAAGASLHRSIVGGGMARMEPAGPLVVPADGSLILEPGGLHGMLMGLTARPQSGDTLAVSLTFQRAGTIDVEVPVVTYADLETSR